MRDAAVRLGEFRLDRDFVEELGVPYNAMTVKMIEAHLQTLRKSKIIHYKPTNGLLEKGPQPWVYSRPKDEGAAAKLDKARKPATPTASNSGPIAGTGRKIKAANKKVQEILDAAVRQVGRDNVFQSGGHWAIITEKGRVLISGTPSSERTLANDRVRLRRAGLVV